MKQVSLPKNENSEYTFVAQVKERSGVNINLCYQCLTCTLSCPVISAMDYLPNQIVRMIQLGDRSEVLQSSAIWLCVSCETCVARCPNEIDIARLMDALRQIALDEKALDRETDIPAFHRIFLKNVRRRGRQYELGMLLALKFKLRDLFSDIGLGIQMLKKRKLSLFPRKVKNREEIEAIFRRSVGEAD